MQARVSAIMSISCSASVALQCSQGKRGVGVERSRPMVMHSPDEAVTPWAAKCVRLVLTSSEIMATSS